MTMITTDQSIAFAPQAGNAPGDDNTSKLVAVTDASYRWLPATNIALGTQQDQKPLPMEMSGALLPRSAYKGASFVSGAVEIIPRTGGSHLHWVLMSMGSSYAHKLDGSAHDHYYGTGDNPIAAWDPTNEASKAASGGGPNNKSYFLSAKRVFPKPDGNASIQTRSGETYEDLRVMAASLTFAPGSPVTMQLGFVGRKSSFVADTSAGSASYWYPAYKDLATDFPGLPDNSTFCLGVRGELNMPDGGTSLNISATGATVDIQAAMTTPQEEQILFSYHPETFEIKARNVTVTINVKRNVLAMYRNIYFGGGSDWSPVVWGNGSPFSIVAKTASDTAFSSFAGEIEFWAQDIAWEMKPIVSKPGQILGAQIVGTVLEPENGSAAWYIRVRNDRDPETDENGDADTGFYDWPS